MGGSEVYTHNQFIKLQNTCNILRLQYNAEYHCFIFSIPYKAVGYLLDFETVQSLICEMNFSEIYINSVASWVNALELLVFIAYYKENNSKTKISFRGHDFHCLCPSFTLLNCDNIFCNLSYKEGCACCIEKIKENTKHSDTILCSEFQDINQWRNTWNQFFSRTVDEVIVFSKSTRELFLTLYPILDKKIKTIPHTIPFLPKVKVRKHVNVNIAILGNMNSIAKGRSIVETMCTVNEDPHIQFVVIGSYRNAPKKLIVTGKYSRSRLPKLIVKYDIDIIFIPSICPETFSYTTSEAIMMGMPVACYNIGAPAERVSKYARGLVIREIEPRKNILEIQRFVKKLRMESE